MLRGPAQHRQRYVTGRAAQLHRHDSPQRRLQRGRRRADHLAPRNGQLGDRAFHDPTVRHAGADDERAPVEAVQPPQRLQRLLATVGAVRSVYAARGVGKHHGIRADGRVEVAVRRHPRAEALDGA